MTVTTIPEEFRNSTGFSEIWTALEEGKKARDRVEVLEAEVERLKGLYQHYREQAVGLADERVVALKRAGFIVLKEGDDITNYINEPDFISWIRWAMTDGWEVITAPTQQLGWGAPTPNADVETIKQALGPIRAELNLE